MKKTECGWICDAWLSEWIYKLFSNGTFQKFPLVNESTSVSDSTGTKVPKVQVQYCLLAVLPDPTWYYTPRCFHRKSYALLTRTGLWNLTHLTIKVTMETIPNSNLSCDPRLATWYSILKWLSTFSPSCHMQLQYFKKCEGFSSANQKLIANHFLEVASYYRITQRNVIPQSG